MHTVGYEGSQLAVGTFVGVAVGAAGAFVGVLVGVLVGAALGAGGRGDALGTGLVGSPFGYLALSCSSPSRPRRTA